MFFDSCFRHTRSGTTWDADVELAARGFPPSGHVAESDLFCRQAAMPGHDQARLESAHIAVIGCGGLGSWIAVGLARMGVTRLTLIDPDRFDRSNGPRQLLYADDLQRCKAPALARNLLAHMSNRATVRAVVAPFDRTVLTSKVSVLIVGVDNNHARLEASDYGLRHQVPVIFAMLSRDGLRTQVFLQRPQGPCLTCVLPNLDAEASAPCAAASMASCFLAGAHALQLVIAAICGSDCTPTWRESSLDGSTERACTPPRRPGCSRRHPSAWLPPVASTSRSVP